MVKIVLKRCWRKEQSVLLDLVTKRGKGKGIMRLLSLELIGEYKGLKDQYFDFRNTEGNILALIGLNGSGKSHS